MGDHSWVFWTVLILGAVCYVGFMAGLIALWCGWWDD